MPIDLSYVYPELEEDTFEYARDWKEVVGTEDPGSLSLSQEAGESKILIQVDWNKARDMVRKVLGFSVADSAAPWRLHRELPVFHPRFPFLIADSISFSGISPKAKDNPSPPPPPPPPPPDPPPSNKIIYGDGIYGPPYSMRMALYDQLRASVSFRDVSWVLLNDDSIPTSQDEMLRYTYWTAEPTIEILSAEGASQLKLKSSDVINTPIGPVVVNDKPVPAAIGTLMAKTTYVLNWMQVPHDYISSHDSILIPDRFEKCIGTVNTEDVGPHKKGTLLMQPPRFTRYRFPVATIDNIHQFFAWNVAIPFQKFDPERAAVDALDPTYPRGHNLMPFRPTLKWYKAVREDGFTMTLKGTDHLQIFKHVRDPS